MTFPGTCACGRQAESFGGLCDRCVALQTLELYPNATESQIEESYRTLVKVWHPDRFQSDEKTRQAAEEKLKEINEAHEFLLSPPDQAPEPTEPGFRPKPPPLPEDRFKAPIETPSEVQEPEDAHSSRKRQGEGPAAGTLVKAALAVVALVAVSLLGFVLDSVLSSNGMTAGAWNQYKGDVSREIHANGVRLWSDATDNLHDKKQESFAVNPSSVKPISHTGVQQPAQPEIPQLAPPPLAQPASYRIPARVIFVSPIPPSTATPPAVQMKSPRHERVAQLASLTLSFVALNDLGAHA